MIGRETEITLAQRRDGTQRLTPPYGERSDRMRSTRAARRASKRRKASESQIAGSESEPQA